MKTVDLIHTLKMLVEGQPWKVSYLWPLMLLLLWVVTLEMMTMEERLQAKRNQSEMLEDFIAAFEYLKVHPECTGKIGVVGFCFGGWIANMMAVRIPDLAAAVPFYGGQPAC